MRDYTGISLYFPVFESDLVDPELTNIDVPESSKRFHDLLVKSIQEVLPNITPVITMIPITHGMSDICVTNEYPYLMSKNKADFVQETFKKIFKAVYLDFSWIFLLDGKEISEEDKKALQDNIRL